MAKDVTGFKAELARIFKDKFENSSIRMPGNIDITEENEYIVMTFLNKQSVGLAKEKNLNMQDTNASFEGWAAAIYAHYGKEKCKKIKLDVAFELEKNFEGNGHYARFLYRILRFSEQYEWFVLSEKLEGVKNLFGEFIGENKGKLTNNCPDSNGKELDEQEENNNGACSEHIVELWMINRGRNALCKALQINENTTIYNQLPVGLFKDNAANANRIFTGGKSAIDMWTITDDKFYMLELKFCNKMIGIMTEAFFYINFVRDLMTPDGDFVLNKAVKNKDVRGYGELINNEHKCKEFCSVMLADAIHPLINKETEAVLNDNNKGIEYRRIKYDFENIEFDFKMI